MTRRTTRSSKSSPSSNTPSTFNFSANPSEKSTPFTSDAEDGGKRRRVTRSSLAGPGSKRKLTEESAEEQEHETKPERPAARRRISQRVYVEISSAKKGGRPMTASGPKATKKAGASTKGKGKGKAKAMSPTPDADNSANESSAEQSDNDTKVKGKGKGKAKAPARSKGKAKAKATPATSDADDVSQVSDDQHDDFNDDLVDSESSGSEFEGSDQSPGEDSDVEDSWSDVEASRVTRQSPRKATRSTAPSEDVSSAVEDDDLPLAAAAAADEDDDEIMMDAAVQLSLESLRESTQNAGSSAGAGSSTAKAEVPRDSAAALRATAAEKRFLLELKKKQDAIDNSEFDEEEAVETADESDVPLKGKKAKAKAKAKAKKAAAPPTTDRIMTIREIREQRKRERRERLQGDPTRKAQLEMRKKLGRKLTPAEKSTIQLRIHHPELEDVWGDLEASVPIPVPQKAEQPRGLKVTLLPFQQESLHWMRKQEQGIWSGGMLADEMGMGKTIQTLALLVSDRLKPNLVVAPTVAVMQWKNEIEAHTEGFKVAVWHGASREKSAAELAKHDVVLTTYAVLESSFRKQHSGFKRKGMIVKEDSPLHTITWARIILDEAHNIKERSTNTAKGAFELQSKYKWCLSGTPLQNRVGELYSLVRFLGGDPFSYYFCKLCSCKSLHWRFADKRTCDECHHSPMHHTCFWNNEILTPIQKHGMTGPGATAFKKLKILLDRMMLRRTKIERADDLGLPPRTVIVRRDYFSAEEKELYLSLFSDAKRQFSTYVDAGTLLNNYSNIFSLITRMRQMACHPDLVLKSKRNQDFSGDVVEATVCRLCHDIAEDAIESKCHHVFDRECIKQYLNTAVEQTPACPVCHVPLSIDLEAPAIEQDEEASNKARQGILGRLNIDTWRSSSKIEALVEELTNLRRQDSTIKSIVFSQFVNFLDLINFRLHRAGFNVCRLEGTMSPQARDAVIKHFMNNVGVTVFLVSLKAGGVALNLTEASRVYLMDSWWNPAVEYQAMDRIHRLGQHRPVQAIKLVVEDSIESRIVQLQEKKSAMINATLSQDDSAMGRLTPEDLSFLFKL